MNRYLFVCVNDNHVHILLPVARCIEAHGNEVHFLSFDTYYANSARHALEKENIPWTELPSSHCKGQWYSYEWGGEAQTIATFEAVRELESFFSAYQPSCAVFGCDLGQLETLTIRAAERHGARTVLVQDGVLSTNTMPEETLSEWLQVGDGGCELLCVWGSGWVGHAKARGIGGEISVTGNPRYDYIAHTESPTNNEHNKTILVATGCKAKYNLRDPKEEVLIYERLLKQLLSQTTAQIILKLHPQQIPLEDYYALGERLGNRVEVIHLESFSAVLCRRKIDLMVTIGSTVAIECAAMGIPIALLSYIDSDFVDTLYRDVPFVYREEERFLSYLGGFPDSFRQSPDRTKTFVENYAGRVDGKAYERVSDEILRHANKQVAPKSISSLVVFDGTEADPVGTVRSILRGTGQVGEIIVADVSTDGTRGESLTQCITDRRFQLIHLPGESYGNALNRLLSTATGEVIACLEGNCTALPGWGESFYESLQESPKRKVSLSWYGARNSNSFIEEKRALPERVTVEWLAHNPASRLSYAYRRDDGLRVGGYREGVVSDLDLITRLTRDGSIYVIQSPLYLTPLNKAFKLVITPPESYRHLQGTQTTPPLLSVVILRDGSDDALARLARAVKAQTLAPGAFELFVVEEARSVTPRHALAQIFSGLTTYSVQVNNISDPRVRSEVTNYTLGERVLYLTTNEIPEKSLFETTLKHQ